MPRLPSISVKIYQPRPAIFGASGCVLMPILIEFRAGCVLFAGCSVLYKKGHGDRRMWYDSYRLHEVHHAELIRQAGHERLAKQLLRPVRRLSLDWFWPWLPKFKFTPAPVAPCLPTPVCACEAI
jgi:hypothetical protein